FLPLYGDHQAQNATIAVAAVESFLGDGTLALDPDVVAEGLGRATSPGRLQLVGVEPTVLVDAAHNPHGAAALATALREYFDFDEFAIVLGVLADKDAHGIVRELAVVASRVDVTRPQSDRALPAEELVELVREDVEPDAVRLHDDVADAVEAAREWAAQSPRRAVVVAGSITLVGEVIALAEAEGWK
ncbi:dihydrofolate synthase, partial [Schumannella luteola]